MKKIRGYMFSRDFMGERVPQHIQNQVIRNYCNDNNYYYLLSAVEYTMTNSQLILNQLLDQSENIDGLGFYSLFQLPKDDQKRQKFLEKVIKKKKFICFCSENFTLKKYSDIERINTVWLIKKKMSNYSDTYNYLRENLYK